MMQWLMFIADCQAIKERVQNTLIEYEVYLSLTKEKLRVSSNTKWVREIPSRKLQL